MDNPKVITSVPSKKKVDYDGVQLLSRSRQNSSEGEATSSSKTMEAYTAFPEFERHNTDGSKDPRKLQTDKSSDSDSGIANQDSTGNSSSNWISYGTWFITSLEKYGIHCECLKDRWLHRQLENPDLPPSDYDQQAIQSQQKILSDMEKHFQLYNKKVVDLLKGLGSSEEKSGTKWTIFQEINKSIINDIDLIKENIGNVPTHDVDKALEILDKKMKDLEDYELRLSRETKLEDPSGIPATSSSLRSGKETNQQVGLDTEISEQQGPIEKQRQQLSDLKHEYEYCCKDIKKHFEYLGYPEEKQKTFNQITQNFNNLYDKVNKQIENGNNTYVEEDALHSLHETMEKLRACQKFLRKEYENLPHVQDPVLENYDAGHVIGYHEVDSDQQDPLEGVVESDQLNVDLLKASCRILQKDFDLLSSGTKPYVDYNKRAKENIRLLQRDTKWLKRYIDNLQRFAEVDCHQISFKEIKEKMEEEQRKGFVHDYTSGQLLALQSKFPTPTKEQVREQLQNVISGGRQGITEIEKIIGQNKQEMDKYLESERQKQKIDEKQKIHRMLGSLGRKLENKAASKEAILNELREIVRDERIGTITADVIRMAAQESNN